MVSIVVVTVTITIVVYEGWHVILITIYKYLRGARAGALAYGLRHPYADGWEHDMASCALSAVRSNVIHSCMTLRADMYCVHSSSSGSRTHLLLDILSNSVVF